MSGLVVDASVAVKWLVTETYSEQAVQLLASRRTLIAPELLFPEVSNALWALHRRGDIAASDYSEALDVLKAAPVAIPASMRQLAGAAGRLAIDLDHPVYDCVYLALAMQEDYRVVTADRRFAKRLELQPHFSDRVLHIASM